MFGSINFARVSAPLCYNYIDLMGVTDTAFDKFMGDADVYPIFG